MPPPLLSQQNPIIVDASGATPGAYPCISQAVAAASPGDTIFIRGLEFDGIPFAYTEIMAPPYWPSQEPEVFPIHIKPGMVLKPLDATAVYIWSSDPNNVPPALLEIDPGNTSVPTKLIDLHLAGATTGIVISGSNGSYHEVLLRRVVFGWHTTALCVTADDGAYVDLTLQDCRLVDHKFAIPMVNDPAYQNPSVGFLFRTLENAASPGRIHAIVNNLKTVGTFLTSELAPSAFTVTPNDLPDFDQVTRLIEVYAEGQTVEHPNQASNPAETQVISEVELELNGGILDGKAGSNSGWDIGLYAALAPNATSSPNDFRSGYEITLAGTEIKDFRVAGIYGTSSTSARGAIHLSGQSKVSGTGKQGSAVANQLYPSGALLFSNQGYLGFHAADAEFSNNLGNGIALDTPRTMGNILYPVGLYLELVDCGIHYNGGNGLALQAGTSENSLIPPSAAIAGGTWDFYPAFPGNRSLVDKGDEPTDLGHGQGIVDRCTISNNGLATGGAGIRVYLESEDPSGGIGREVFANLRFVNSFAWNNGGGAFRGSLLGDQAWLLTPVVHSTFVGNATSTPPYTMEVVEMTRANGLQSIGNYEWQEASNFFLRNRLFDSIFQRDPSQQTSDPDFGPVLAVLVVEDTNPTGFLQSGHKIGAAGCRSYPDLGYPHWTDLSAPFMGPIALLSTEAGQFLLQRVGGLLDPGFDLTPVFLSVDAPEANSDFLLHPRPDVSTGDRDKGAHQVE